MFLPWLMAMWISPNHSNLTLDKKKLTCRRCNKELDIVPWPKNCDRKKCWMGRPIARELAAQQLQCEPDDFIEPSFGDINHYEEEKTPIYAPTRYWGARRLGNWIWDNTTHKSHCVCVVDASKPCEHPCCKLSGEVSEHLYLGE